MGGSRIGGLKAREKNLARDLNYYRNIAKKSHQGWIKNGRKPRGFSAMPSEKHKTVSAKGGMISRR